MFTEFDVIVCVIVMICALSSAIRGGLEDVLALLAWLGSGLITLFFYPYASAHLGEWFNSSMLANVVAVILVFIASLTVIVMVNATIIRGTEEFQKGTVNRLFGLVFGVFKGIAIASTIHFIVTLASNDEPGWLTAGETYELTEKGANIIEDLSESFISGGQPQGLEAGVEAVEESLEF